MYSLADSTYDRVGYNRDPQPTCHRSPEYKTENFGPFGIYGGQTRAIDKIETDHISKVTSDEFYTPGNSMSQLYTQKTNFNDFALPYSPGTTKVDPVLKQVPFIRRLNPELAVG